MTLQEIKDKYAVSVGYDNFELLLWECNVETMNKHINEVMKIYARECLKLASMNAVVFFNDDFAEVNKESITNEKNIIL